MAELLPTDRQRKILDQMILGEWRRIAHTWRNQDIRELVLLGYLEARWWNQEIRKIRFPSDELLRCLSLHQPWANWVRDGEKPIETRMWETRYRGPLLIASTKVPKIEPAGFVLALTDLVDCRLMTKADEEKAKCPYEPGRFAWVLENIRPVKPIPIRGFQRIFKTKIRGSDLTFQVWGERTLPGRGC